MILDELLRNFTWHAKFNTANTLSFRLEKVAKMMKVKDGRGTDRDIFYVAAHAFDTHFNQTEAFTTLLPGINTGIEEFRKALIDEGLWDSVTIVMVSEFGRTLRENTNAGTDHGKPITCKNNSLKRDMCTKYLWSAWNSMGRQLFHNRWRRQR